MRRAQRHALGRSGGGGRLRSDTPLEYPPLAKCTTPGDRVVIALGAEVPQVAQVTAAIVQTLVSAGIDPDGITILRPAKATWSRAPKTHAA